jgi:hypothetical protein
MRRIGTITAVAAAAMLVVPGTALAHVAYAGDTYTFKGYCGQNALPLVKAQSDAFVEGTVRFDYDPNSGTTVTAKIVDTPGDYELVTRCARQMEDVRSTFTVRPKPPAPQPNPKPKPNKPPQVKVKPVGPAQTGGGATAQF